MFFIARFEKAAKIGKITVYLFVFVFCLFVLFSLISLLIPEFNGLKTILSDQKVAKKLSNQSKSLQFVMSCAGHIDGMEKE